MDDIDEAIRDFDKDRGVIAIEEKMNGQSADTDSELNISEEVEESQEQPEEIEESVKTIALDHPDWGPSKIAKELNTEKYGFIRVSTISLWKILRQLNLGSKKQRETVKKQKKSKE